MRKIALLVQNGEASALLEARAELLALLIQLFFPRSLHPPEHALEQSLASRIRATLDLALPTNFQHQSLPNILIKLGYSYEHLCRAFSSTYGISPQQYLLAIRLTRAQVLLRTTTLTAADIGQQLGFNSPAYFVKVFRQHTQQTPGQYRNKTKEGEIP